MLLLLLTPSIGEMALSENRPAQNPVVDYHFPLSKRIDIYIYIQDGVYKWLERLWFMVDITN